ncbi:leucine-rich repeat and immunoglobulin-like domain-containing nogo receptor-interacting protein 2b [Gouania willdenowi]|uniref:Leucine-rich repeat and immunoglobulin-like domain-containing nogo receptor-interacting protein 2 n=1 Tax=Gouania willdenowi TaxID=441366 RepID=A0A8C5DMJ3_GOUWI|nr:leucine-rich repeat and immunoglobulin-like domain-containing nogo receptor-interacting protein 2 [Gouania willdenowi]XP_028294388.1 leucine-rich repeat and immunoglobulin-like domain-containing nogo receptor-interacting protein 2 [Gouania willdenowi]XP_028294389.1 leucine-rich repeat and immunoglobulin-like domain-containing nogo receptor-interacting protein 2 [Gouania willdenowi]XP_028294390.1 leucine-rich repeat and immunoglobulin-like domain-containing nogo receptor-interacting protein 2 
MKEANVGKRDMQHLALLHWHLFLGGALLLLLASPALSCPARCECSAQTKSVSCHRKRLPCIPEGIPIETRALDLSKNKLRIITPDNFSSFQQLEDLDLSDNLISVVEPGSFRSQLALRSLNFRSNLLQLVPAGVLSGLTNLTHLDLSHNRLVVLLDHAFQDLRRLTSLEVGDNELVFVSQRAFTGLLTLQSLTLERSNLTVVPTEALSHLHSLVELHMRYLSISFLKPFSFKRLSSLRHLEIDFWPWLDALPTFSLHGLNLTTLFITNTNLSAFPGQALRSLPYLTHLNLSYSHIQHIHQGELGQFPHLVELRLQGAQLLSIEPLAFLGLKSLQLLDVSQNHLDSLERGVFGSPDSLQRLCLGGNPLVCDCRLLWLLNVHKPPSLQVLDLQPECSAPEHLLGKTLRELKEPLVSRYMTCTKPRIGPNTTQLLMADEGQPARLSCMAEGAPRPSVVWVTPHRRYITTKSSGRVEVQSDGTLEIKAAELHDSGVYLCIASNPAGNASLSASLAVKSTGIADRSYHSNRSSNSLTDSNNTWGNGTVLYNMTLPIDIKTIIISTAMGCLSFLGVVIFCFLLLFAWSRGKGRHKSNFDIEYVPRKSNGASAEVAETSGPRRVNMKMI